MTPPNPQRDDLAPSLQPLANDFIAARSRGGAALLEAAALLALARSQATHGAWIAFLAATDTSQDVAERLLAIHRRARADPAFTEAVVRQWLTFSVAALLARISTPPEVVTAALNAPIPPQARAVQAAIAKAKRSRPSRADNLFGERQPFPLPRPTAFRSTPDAIRWAYVAEAISWDEAQELRNRQRDTALLLLEDVERIDRWFKAQRAHKESA